MVEHALLLPTLDSLPQQLLILDGEGTVVTVNRAWHDFREAQGLPSMAPVGLAYHATLDDGTVTPGADRDALVAGIRSVMAGTVKQFRHTYQLVTLKRSLWLELFAVAMPAGRSGAVVSLFDVTRERESESHLQVQANHDALTGLPNRRSFERDAERALSLASRRGSSAALVFLDLDGFKEINDAYGHAAGDGVLVHVAQRLQGEIRASDVLARWGGDEFVMLLPDLAPAEYGDAVERYRVVLGRPTRVDGQVHRVRASFGAAFYPYEGLTVTELVNQADEAMYVDKAARRGAKARGTNRGRGWIGAGAAQEGRVPALWSRLRIKGV